MEEDQYVVGFNKYGYTRDDTIVTQSFYLCYVIVLGLVFALSHELISRRKLDYISEPTIALTLGVIVAVLTNWATEYNDELIAFSPRFFFLFFLPPLIFQGGFTQGRKELMSNWLVISLYANIGTVVSTVVFGYVLYHIGASGYTLPLSLMECLSFGALISATDPVSTLSVFSQLKVSPSLTAIVYGSAALDDAIAIIMYFCFSNFVGKGEDLSLRITETVVGYMFVCIIASTMLGFVLGGLVAYTIKICSWKNDKKTLMCVVFAFMYGSFYIGTALQISGIMVSLFASISFRYLLELGDILKKEDFQLLDDMLKFFAGFVETTCFFSIGMSVGSIFSDTDRDYFDASLTFWSLFITFVARAAFVYPLSAITNLYNAYIQRIENDRKLASVASAKVYGDRKRAHTSSRIEAEDRNTGDEAPRPIEIVRNRKLIPIRYIGSHLNLNTQHMILFSGLKGPLAYAAAETFRGDYKEVVCGATAVIVLFNVLINGSLTATLVRFLGIEHNVEEEEELQQQRHHEGGDEDEEEGDVQEDAKWQRKYYEVNRNIGAECGVEKEQGREDPMKSGTVAGYMSTDNSTNSADGLLEYMNRRLRVDNYSNNDNDNNEDASDNDNDNESFHSARFLPEMECASTSNIVLGEKERGEDRDRKEGKRANLEINLKSRHDRPDDIESASELPHVSVQIPIPPPASTSTSTPEIASSVRSKLWKASTMWLLFDVIEKDVLKPIFARKMS